MAWSRISIYDSDDMFLAGLRDEGTGISSSGSYVCEGNVEGEAIMWIFGTLNAQEYGKLLLTGTTSCGAKVASADRIKTSAWRNSCKLCSTAPELVHRSPSSASSCAVGGAITRGLSLLAATPLNSAGNRKREHLKDEAGDDETAISFAQKGKWKSTTLAGDRPFPQIPDYVSAFSDVPAELWAKTCRNAFRLSCVKEIERHLQWSTVEC
ncbi:hypothetical protein DL96DRAFT_1760964 [Flagelloscypha sp. PMI_526]|nr:hypothetical protein DL96DRAFT_1760964 [Flagelloscypha sp. PMI_526]